MTALVLAGGARRVPRDGGGAAMTALVLAGGARRVPRDGGGAAMTALVLRSQAPTHVPAVCRAKDGVSR